MTIESLYLAFPDVEVPIQLQSSCLHDSVLSVYKERNRKPSTNITASPEVKQIIFSCTTGLEIYVSDLNFAGSYA
jgi:hypothetical protein